MKIIAGLGNPGRKYERTKHNMGFMVIDEFARRHGVSVNTDKFDALYGRTIINGETVLLVKPQTFMNLSGKSVLQLSAFFRIPPERIIVMFDDISLDPGRLRLRAEGSAGGHNGIKSIIAELGSQSFPRVKIGVGAKPHKDYDLAAWVLGVFNDAEEKALAPALKYAGEAALAIIDKGMYEAANRYNGIHS